MSDFSVFAEKVKANFDLMAKNELFVTQAEPDDLWNLYLSSFPEGTNPIFRERTEHDCSCCRQFIRSIANLVAIVDDKLTTIWDVEGLPYPYDVVADYMHNEVLNYNIKGVYRTDTANKGLKQNFELIDGKTVTWNHFYAVVPSRFVSATPEAKAGSINTSFEVLTRGLTELTTEALHTVIDLIESDNLYRGEEHLQAVKEFLALKEIDSKATTTERIKAAWSNATKPVARFRNTVIGTLVTDISNGVPLEKAVASFEAKVAPTNYKRTTAVITPGMVKEALKKVEELGIEESLERRFANISDISINNVLWADATTQVNMKDGLKELLMASAKKPVNSKVQAKDITAEDFMANVMPLAKSISLYVGNEHVNNFVSLTAPVYDTAPNIFQWDNSFGWSYDGNITDSIKERVKTAGGNTNAPLRVSLAWHNSDDQDLHCECPEGHIYHGYKNGILDVDMNAFGAKSDTHPVENMSWTKPKDGRYIFNVNMYSKRTKERPGFTIEIENDGKVQQFTYSKDFTGNIQCISFNLLKGKVTDLAINPIMTQAGLPQKKWGTTTEQFVKVSTIMNSPNHWDGQSKGNKHVFFILDQCVNPDSTRGIYNEFLMNELTPHRKVFETIAAKTMCPSVPNQLSGVGFSSTRKDTVLAQVVTDKATINYSIKF